MINFTNRFSEHLIKMAEREVDLSVRVASINVLRLIDGHGLSHEEKREDIATLVFEEDKRVRQAVSGFVGDLLNEKVQEKGIELAAATRGGNKKKGKDAVEQQTQLEIKCLAELLVKYGEQLDGEEEDDEVIVQLEGEEEVVAVKTHKGRIAFAVEALWDQVEPIRNWEAIMNFLLLDHSIDGTSGNDSTPKKGGKNANKKGGNVDDLADACKLTEKEESLLVEVLVASLGKVTAKSSVSKKVARIIFVFEKIIDTCTDTILPFS